MASCELHALTAEGHCSEIEKMLEHVPKDMLEGDGDSPSDAIERLRGAYEDADDEISALREALSELVEKCSPSDSKLTCIVCGGRHWLSDDPDDSCIVAKASAMVTGSEER